MKDTCVFVSSSDNTFDVFNQVSSSIVKNWPIDNLDIYVGLNARVADKPFCTISAPISGWRTELEYQISRLPEKYQFIILVLDDFFFFDRVDYVVLARLVDEMKYRDIDYLRLKSLERSMLGNIVLYFRRVLSGNSDLVKLGRNEPYFASLQVAVWKRAYLSKLLSQTGSIWDFEHTVEVGAEHYATAHNYLRYEHLVEKGKWFRHAPDVLENANKEYFRERGFDNSQLKHSKLFNKVKFMIFGYVFFRIRRAIMRCTCR